MNFEPTKTKALVALAGFFTYPRELDLDERVKRANDIKHLRDQIGHTSDSLGAKLTDLENRYRDRQTNFWAVQQKAFQALRIYFAKPSALNIDGCVERADAIRHLREANPDDFALILNVAALEGAYRAHLAKQGYAPAPDPSSTPPALPQPEPAAPPESKPVPEPGPAYQSPSHPEMYGRLSQLRSRRDSRIEKIIGAARMLDFTLSAIPNEQDLAQLSNIFAAGLRYLGKADMARNFAVSKGSGSIYVRIKEAGLSEPEFTFAKNYMTTMKEVLDPHTRYRLEKTGT